MTRVLLALLFAAGLTVAANAAVVQFSIDGVPIDPAVPVEVEPSDWLMVDVWIVPDAGGIENFWVDVLMTGPWPEPILPQIPDLLPGGEVVMLPPWDNEDAVAYYDAGYDVYSIGGFVRGDPWVGPGGVAEFLVHIPDVPISTILNLEYDYVEIGAGTAETLPLILHVTPEPATIGLLVLGGLAALRRRFA
ncbi:MAG TPA: PEP-CTERM sorting domain-containing protein [Phycisphaerae bacterium]|nr:PEP-CTERM sorting domain-containing protein [Phycisphaerae bacterium]